MQGGYCLQTKQNAVRFYQSVYIYIFQFNDKHVYGMRDRLLLVPYDASRTNQLEAQLFVATSVKGLCRGTISQYLDL